MRPLRLKLEGLHSFREPQEIDFTTLCEAGVFGIFGPTGSGKSTILDAITLALYGKVERANKNTQGIINHAADRVLVEFSFEIGLPGQKQTYRVERLYKRVGDNNVNARVVRIVELTPAGEVVLADKEREVTQKVQDVIGLTVEDFTRAVVLPQGRFAEFLSLRDADRRKMLQRLFALEDYGDKLNERLKRRWDQVNKQLIGITAEQQGLGDASAEALAQQQALLVTSQAQVQAAGVMRMQKLLEYDQQKQVWELQQELESTQQAIQVHLQRLPAVVVQEEELAAAKRADQVLPWISAAQQAAAGTAQLSQQLAQDTARYQHAAEQEKHCREVYLHCQEQRRWEEPRLIEQKTKLEAALLQEQELNQLQLAVQELEQQIRAGQTGQQELNSQYQRQETDRQQAHARLTELKARMSAIQVTPDLRQDLAAATTALTELKRLDTQVEAAQAEVAQRQSAVTTAEQALTTSTLQLTASQERVLLQEKLLAAHQENCPASEEQVYERQESCERGKTQVAELARCEQEAGQLEQEVVTLEKELLQARQVSEQAQAQLDQHRSALATAQQNSADLEMRYRELESRNLAALLAAGLEANQPCPVCGSAHHPNPAEQFAQHDLAVLKTDLTAATSLVNHQQSALQGIMVQATEAQTKVQHLENQLQQLQQSWQAKTAATLAVRQTLKEGSREKSLTELRDLLVKLEQRLDGDKKARLSWLKELEKLQSELAQAKTSQGQIEKEHSAAETNLANFRQSLTEAQDKLQQLVQASTNQQAQVIQAAAQVNTRLNSSKDFGWTGWTEVAATTSTFAGEYSYLERLVQQIQDFDLELEINQVTQQGLEQEIAQLQKELEETAATLNRLKIELAADTAKHTNLTQQVQVSLVQLQVLTAGQAVQTLLLATQTNLQQIGEQESQAAAALETASKQREQAERKQAETTVELQLASAKQQEAEAKLQEMLTTTGFATEQEAQASACNLEEQQALVQSTQLFRQEEQTLQTDLQRLQTRLAGRGLTAEQWESWLAEKVRVEQEYEQASNTVSVAAAQLEQLQQKHQRWSQLEAERVTKTELKDRLETLQRLFRGNAFVEFIAEEQVISVALAASNRLKQMTRNRYALEVDAEGGFVMRDDSNGGVKRPVSTLSGGETFLTSLALALALSAQIQLKGQFPLEFFFLDEGFGTLDPELLDKVMSTLEELPADRMAIGVISHVPEMRHRMPRRLIVEAEQPGGRGSQVSFEVM